MFVCVFVCVCVCVCEVEWFPMLLTAVINLANLANSTLH